MTGADRGAGAQASILTLVKQASHLLAKWIDATLHPEVPFGQVQEAIRQSSRELEVTEPQEHWPQGKTARALGLFFALTS
jgi:hypothetical protein